MLHLFTRVYFLPRTIISSCNHSLGESSTQWEEWPQQQILQPRYRLSVGMNGFTAFSDRPRWITRSVCGSRYWVWIPAGSDVRGCAYTVLKYVRSHGVYSTVYGTVHYKETLIVQASDVFLSRYCHDCAESDVKQYSLSLSLTLLSRYLRQTTV